MGGVIDVAKSIYKPIIGGIFGIDKPKKPKLPALPPPPKFDAAAANKSAQAAALMKKKAAESAQGYGSTNLTGGSGLLGVPSMYQGTKTLTGT